MCPGLWYGTLELKTISRFWDQYTLFWCDTYSSTNLAVLFWTHFSVECLCFMSFFCCWWSTWTITTVILWGNNDLPVWGWVCVLVYDLDISAQTLFWLTQHTYNHICLSLQELLVLRKFMEFVGKRVFEELVQFYLVTLQYACSPYTNVCIQAVQVYLHM